MYERQVELTVGQTLQVGDVMLTIVDIEGDEIHVRVDNDGDQTLVGRGQRELVLSLPR